MNLESKILDIQEQSNKIKAELQNALESDRNSSYIYVKYDSWLNLNFYAEMLSESIGSIVNKDIHGLKSYKVHYVYTFQFDGRTSSHAGFKLLSFDENLDFSMCYGEIVKHFKSLEKNNDSYTITDIMGVLQ